MVSEKPWTFEAVVRLFLGIIATFCFGVTVAGLLEKAATGWNDNQRLFAQLVAAGLFFQVSALVWVGFFIRVAHVTWGQAFGVTNPGRTRAVALGVMAGIGILPVAMILQEASAWLMESVRLHPEAQTVIQELQKPEVPWFETAFLGFLAIVIAPLAEEVMFRGVLYPTIKQAGYPRTALWATSILFGLSHVSMVTFAPLTVFAVLLTVLYEATDNLLAPIVAHSLFNAINFCIVLFASQLEHLLLPLEHFLHLK